MLNLSFYIIVPSITFLTGLFGIIINRRSILLNLLCIEIVLLSVNLNFVIFSVYLDDNIGQLFALFVLTVAAAESAVGLAILIVLFRNLRSINVRDMNKLKN